MKSPNQCHQYHVRFRLSTWSSTIVIQVLVYFCCPIIKSGFDRIWMNVTHSHHIPFVVLSACNRGNMKNVFQPVKLTFFQHSFLIEKKPIIFYASRFYSVIMNWLSIYVLVKIVLPMPFWYQVLLVKIFLRKPNSCISNTITRNLERFVWASFCSVLLFCLNFFRQTPPPALPHIINTRQLKKCNFCFVASWRIPQ